MPQHHASELASKQACSTGCCSIITARANPSPGSQTPTVQQCNARQICSAIALPHPQILLLSHSSLSRGLTRCNQASQGLLQLLCCGPISSLISPALRQAHSSAEQGTMSEARQEMAADENARPLSSKVTELSWPASLHKIATSTQAHRRHEPRIVWVQCWWQWRARPLHHHCLVEAPVVQPLERSRPGGSLPHHHAKRCTGSNGKPMHSGSGSLAGRG
jgi:hypothetical protein